MFSLGANSVTKYGKLRVWKVESGETFPISPGRMMYISGSLTIPAHQNLKGENVAAVATPAAGDIIETNAPLECVATGLIQFVVE